MGRQRFVFYLRSFLNRRGIRTFVVLNRSSSRRQQGAHLEHLSSTLAVTGGDNRGVAVEKLSLLVEDVGSIGESVSHTENRGELKDNRQHTYKEGEKNVLHTKLDRERK